MDVVCDVSEYFGVVSVVSKYMVEGTERSGFAEEDLGPFLQAGGDEYLTSIVLDLVTEMSFEGYIHAADPILFIVPLWTLLYHNRTTADWNATWLFGNTAKSWDGLDWHRQ